MITNYSKKALILFLFIFISSTIFAQLNTRFEQLGTLLPTPNVYRTASGAPGENYWQQQVDYDIKVELNDIDQSIQGSEVITYTNHSPHALSYIWIQLDQNIFSHESMSYQTMTGSMDSAKTFSLKSMDVFTIQDFDGGFKIIEVKDAKDKKLSFVINQTMMRIDLPFLLQPHSSYSFSIRWNNKIPPQHSDYFGRAGYEYFPTDQNYIYLMGQWFPRVAVYSDVRGWQNKQYLGMGEFALNFGNYKVQITVPADHTVTATGELKNVNQVLSLSQRERFEKAKTSLDPVLIITPEEALKNEKNKSKEKKTWVFEAKNVRDFAWASSRKFIWDAKLASIGKNNVWTMSFYPNEANPFWETYSTKAVEHALKVYSKYTLDYPYPVAISVSAGFRGGMEYPMMGFNGSRPSLNRKYSNAVKYRAVSIIMHETGHSFFPMIINSDERQWLWIDEGLNSFLQFLAEQEWEQGYPSKRGFPYKLVDYMSSKSDTLEPIMINAESIIQRGNNAYGKVAVGLNILRETIMGRVLFDHAFKIYVQRWAFKHPEPADFFRTMEDASAVDLDWFWKGWFYGTDPVDISIENVKCIKLYSKDTDQSISKKEEIDNYFNSLIEEEKKQIQEDRNFYSIQFRNKGGMIMPLIVKFIFEDQTEEIHRIPAEVWRRNNQLIAKTFITKKIIKSVELDPYLETTDINRENNYFSKEINTSYLKFSEKEKN